MDFCCFSLSTQKCISCLMTICARNKFKIVCQDGHHCRCCDSWNNMIFDHSNSNSYMTKLHRMMYMQEMFKWWKSEGFRDRRVAARYHQQLGADAWITLKQERMGAQTIIGHALMPWWRLQFLWAMRTACCWDGESNEVYPCVSGKVHHHAL